MALTLATPAPAEVVDNHYSGRAQLRARGGGTQGRGAAYTSTPTPACIIARAAPPRELWPRRRRQDAPRARDAAPSRPGCPGMHAPVATEDNRLLHSIPAARVALIERIARAATGVGGRRTLRQRLLRTYFHG